MKLVKYAYIFFAACLLTACVATRVTPEKKASIGRIAVVSLVEDALHAGDVSGLLGVFNPIPPYAVPQWQLRKRIENDATVWLAGHGYDVVRLDYPADEIREAANDPWARWVNSKFELLADAIKPYVEGHNVDAVVIIFPGGQDERCRGGEVCHAYGSKGFGAFIGPGFFGQSKPHVYASIDVLVIAVPDGEILALSSYGEVLMLRSDLEILDEFESYSERDQSAIRQNVDVLLDRSINLLLSNVGL